MAAIKGHYETLNGEPTFIPFRGSDNQADDVELFESVLGNVRPDNIASTQFADEAASILEMADRLKELCGERLILLRNLKEELEAWLDVCSADHVWRKQTDEKLKRVSKEIDAFAKILD